MRNGSMASSVKPVESFGLLHIFVGFILTADFVCTTSD